MPNYNGKFVNGAFVIETVAPYRPDEIKEFQSMTGLTDEDLKTVLTNFFISGITELTDVIILIKLGYFHNPYLKGNKE